jgi:hypothetical protein
MIFAFKFLSDKCKFLRLFAINPNPKLEKRRQKLAFSLFNVLSMFPMKLESKTKVEELVKNSKDEAISSIMHKYNVKKEKILVCLCALHEEYYLLVLY